MSICLKSPWAAGTNGKHPHSFYYWGSLEGFYSWLYWDIGRNYCIAFMTNTKSMPQWAHPFFTAALLGIMDAENIPMRKEPRTEPIDLKRSETFTGKYLIENIGSVEIQVKENRKILTINKGMGYQLYKVSDRLLYVPGIDCWLGFGNKKEDTFTTIYWFATVANRQGSRIQSQ